MHCYFIWGSEGWHQWQHIPALSYCQLVLFNQIKAVISLCGIAISVSFLHSPLILRLQLLLTPTVSSRHSWFSSYSYCGITSLMVQLLLLLWHHISLLFLNRDVVEQSHSKGVNCSEVFRPRGSSSVTRLNEDHWGWNVSLQFILLAPWFAQQHPCSV